MLTFFGRNHKYCDKVSRRDFLRVGALALGGLSLTDVLRLRAQAAAAESRPKSVIMIWLGGGPSHLDTYDLKPDLPAESRSEFKPIRTKVPGLDICELMPFQAKIADKLAVLRGVRTEGNHTANEFYSGYAFEQGNGASKGVRRPAFGSVVSRLRGPRNSLPPYVSFQDQPNYEQPYFVGAAHQPFRVNKYDKVALDNLQLGKNMTRERLEDRKALLHSFDGLRQNLERSAAQASVDAITAQALDIISSNRVRDAFDVSKEPSKLQDRYGTTPGAFGFVAGTDMLRARRLVEAGVSVVTLAIHGWDTHEKNFEFLRKTLPVVDQALHALITDLEDRGLLDDVAILMGGEMGRAPKITPLNGTPGRDHWPQTGITIMAGGGLTTGQVVGASDAKGERPLGRPITPPMMMATLYHVLGIDPATTIPDHNGRPMYLLEDRDPISEVI
jgi:hypothetical protein